MSRLLRRWGFARRTAAEQAALDLAEAHLTLLATAKLREYYTAVERMLQQRIARLEQETRRA